MASTSISGQLDYGATGQDVKTLQDFLVANGYMTSAQAQTGYGTFGPQTLAALQQFQAASGIVSSGTPTTTGYGRVGPTTLSSINNKISAMPSLPSAIAPAPSQTAPAPAPVYVPPTQNTQTQPAPQPAPAPVPPPPMINEPAPTYKANDVIKNNLNEFWQLGSDGKTWTQLKGTAPTSYYDTVGKQWITPSGATPVATRAVPTSPTQTQFLVSTDGYNYYYNAATKQLSVVSAQDVANHPEIPMATTNSASVNPNGSSISAYFGAPLDRAFIGEGSITPTYATGPAAVGQATSKYTAAPTQPVMAPAPAGTANGVLPVSDPMTVTSKNVDPGMTASNTSPMASTQTTQPTLQQLASTQATSAAPDYAQGADVKAIQDFLVKNKYMTQAQVDTGYGTYGPQTLAAVKAWQTANNVTTDPSQLGYWGPKSVAAATPQGFGTSSTFNIGTAGNPTGATLSGQTPAIVPSISNPTSSVDKALTSPIGNTTNSNTFGITPTISGTSGVTTPNIATSGNTPTGLPLPTANPTTAQDTFLAKADNAVSQPLTSQPNPQTNSFGVPAPVMTTADSTPPVATSQNTPAGLTTPPVSNGVTANMPENNIPKTDNTISSKDSSTTNKLAQPSVSTTTPTVDNFGTVGKSTITPTQITPSVNTAPAPSPQASTSVPNGGGLYGSLIANTLQQGGMSPELRAAYQSQKDYNDALAKQYATNSSNPIPLQFQQGRNQVLQQLAAVQQANNAQNIANLEKQQGIGLSAAQAAMGAATPVQVTPGNTLTQSVNGQSIGTPGFQTLTDLAKAKANIAIGQDTQTQAANLNTTLSQIDSLSPTLTKFMTDANINPSDQAFKNTPINLYQQLIGNPANQTTFNAMMADVKTYAAQILGASGLNPTEITSMLGSFDPSNLTMEQLTSFLANLKNIGQARLAPLQQTATNAYGQNSVGGAYVGQQAAPSINSSVMQQNTGYVAPGIPVVPQSNPDLQLGEGYGIQAIGGLDNLIGKGVAGAAGLAGLVKYLKG